MQFCVDNRLFIFFFVVGCRFVDPILTSIFFGIFFRIKTLISFFIFVEHTDIEVSVVFGTVSELVMTFIVKFA